MCIRDRITNEISSVSFSSEGDYFLTNSFLWNDYGISVWETRTGKIVKTLKGFSNKSFSVGFLNDNILLGSLNDNDIKYREISRNRFSNSITENSSKAEYLNFSPDGTFFSVVFNDGTIRLFDSESGEEFRYIDINDFSLTPVIYSLNGNYIAVLLKNGKSKIWETEIEDDGMEFGGDDILVALSSNGLYAAAVNPSDGTFKLMDLLTEREIVTLDNQCFGIPTAAFSYDDRYITAGYSDKSVKVWDTEDGTIMWHLTGHNSGVESVCFSKNGYFLAAGSQDGSVIVWNLQNGQEICNFKPHSNWVTSLWFSDDDKYVLSKSYDNKAKLSDALSGQEIITLVPIEDDNYIIVTPDYYYSCTKGAYNGIAFVLGNSAYPFEQFDLQYNRPDITLGRIGYAPKELIEGYKKAYEKRLKKMKFTEDMFSSEFRLPEIEILNKNIPLSTDKKVFTLEVIAEDEKYNLNRINVYINEVPVFGVNGIDLSGKNIHSENRNIEIELSEGLNKIQVSVLNDIGIESLKETVEIRYDGAKRKNITYFFGIGVSQYQNPFYNLYYASKDIRDLAGTFAEQKTNVIIDTLIDNNATRENILNIKDKLLKTNVDDEVIISFSGHGLLNDSLDFYFATYDVDFKRPETRGVKFEEIDWLLDGIPARKKVLFLDACHSGEVDKEEFKLHRTKGYVYRVDTGEVKFKKGVVEIINPDFENETPVSSSLGLQNSFELMQELFTDLSKGNGAVVIAAAAGFQYAFEGENWNNGVFTYCVIMGLKEKKADKNDDGIISISELKEFVSKQVEELTNGNQKPTSRREIIENDFRVW